MTSESPTTHAGMEAQYRKLLAEAQNEHDQLARRRTSQLQVLAALGVGAVVLASQSTHRFVSPWLFVALFAAMAAVLVQSLRLQTKVARMQRVLAFYDVALERVSGAKRQSGRTGVEDGQSLRPASHLYERDFDILGSDSLFGLLATVRTGPGERGLARYLLEPATRAETLERQEAVKELLPQTALREEIALLGASKFHQIPASFFDVWLDEPAPAFHPAFRWVLLLTAALNVALLLVGLTHLRTWGAVLPNLALSLGIQGVVCLYLRSKVMPLLEGGARLELNVRLLGEGLALMQRGSFSSAKLVALQRASLEPAGAVKLLQELVSSLMVVEQRTKEWFLLLSLLVAAGTQAAMSLATWKRRNSSAMRGWLQAWAEFEALNALATYAFEHPEDAWPELMEESEGPRFEAQALGHPLLDGAVRNDVTLGAETRFYLISGSNMSGKSTLMRSIGVNAVLAYAGAPVRARRLRLSPMRIGASLALTDSLAEGRSKFLAEVERLAAIATLSAHEPLLFLVDEIFSGTNSADRGTAAAAVLARLLGNGAIGALSTHDLALTDLAGEDSGGRNVHMASPDADDPLAFDYLLKPGPNRTTNALAIIRMLGL